MLCALRVFAPERSPPLFATRSSTFLCFIPLVSVSGEVLFAGVLCEAGEGSPVSGDTAR